MVRYEDDCVCCDWGSCSGCPYQYPVAHFYCDDCGEEVSDDYNEFDEDEEHLCDDCYFDRYGYYKGKEPDTECEKCGELFCEDDLYNFISYNKKIKLLVCDDCYNELEEEDDKKKERDILYKINRKLIGIKNAIHKKNTKQKI